MKYSDMCILNETLFLEINALRNILNPIPLSFINYQ